MGPTCAKRNGDRRRFGWASLTACLFRWIGAVTILLSSVPCTAAIVLRRVHDFAEVARSQLPTTKTDPPVNAHGPLGPIRRALPWHDDHVPKGAKYVVSLRDPKDAFVSGYRFMEGWYFEPGTISYEAFFEPRRSRGKGLDHWAHLLSWWGQRDNPDVLLLSSPLAPVPFSVMPPVPVASMIELVRVKRIPSLLLKSFAAKPAAT